MRLIPCVPAILSIAFLLSAQDAGRGGPPAASAPRAMTLAIPGFPDGNQIPVKLSQAAPGVAPGIAGDELGQRARGHAELLPPHARLGSRPQQDYGRSS